MGTQTPSDLALYRCDGCQKFAYADRAVARRASRVARTRGLHPYRCPTSDVWHLGHMAEDIRRGLVDRRTAYGCPA